MTVTHDQFTVARTCRASLATCWQAWSDETVKSKWFAEGDGGDFTNLSYGLDFRVGGREHGKWRRKSTGSIHSNETIIMDIVDHGRIIFAYAMMLDDLRHSASLATVTFSENGGETTITYFEQSTFFGGVDDAGMRASGVNWQFDRLKAQLEAAREHA